MTKQEITWLENPMTELRKYPNGTIMLMRSKGGVISFCTLSGNIPSDVRWKFQRWPDGKTLVTETMVARGASFALIGPL